MKQIHITMPEQMIAALKAKSLETGLAVAEIIRRAVDAALAVEVGNDRNSINARSNCVDR